MAFVVKIIPYCTILTTYEKEGKGIKQNKSRRCSFFLPFYLGISFGLMSSWVEYKSKIWKIASISCLLPCILIHAKSQRSMRVKTFGGGMCYATRKKCMMMEKRPFKKPMCLPACLLFLLFYLIFSKAFFAQAVSHTKGEKFSFYAQ